MEHIVFIGNFHSNVDANLWSTLMNRVVHPFTNNESCHRPIHQVMTNTPSLDLGDAAVDVDIFHVLSKDSCRGYFESVLEILDQQSDESIIVVTQNVMLSDFHPGVFQEILVGADIVLDSEALGDVIIGYVPAMKKFLRQLQVSVGDCRTIIKDVAKHLTTVRTDMTIRKERGLISDGSTKIRQTRVSCRNEFNRRVLFESYRGERIWKDAGDLFRGSVDMKMMQQRMMNWGVFSGMILLLIVLLIFVRPRCI